ncbi:MAG: adenylate kinase [Bacteroidaceae bacterium]|nr:adenylate kinase [Bacteroidaceae bacterium]
MNIVIFGAPGSGKGTQSALLIEEYGYYHISTGDVLRAQIAQGTELGKIADSYISKGQLIPDELMIDILDEVLAEHPESAKGVIFDGFPRTIHQAETLDALLAKRNGKVDVVVGLEVEEEELIERLINRGKTSGRSDDNLDTIKKRLDVYNNQTNVLRDHYKSQGKYEAVHGMGSIESIFENIKTLIEKHRSR